MAANGTAWALITGAGTGIGRGIALAMLRKGISVIAIGRRENPLRELQQEAQSLDAQVLVMPADVATEQGRQAIQKALQERDSKLQYVVHNAGLLGEVKPLTKVTLEAWRQVFAVNVEAPVFLTQALLPFFSDKTRVLHISSGAAQKAIPGWATYCASKAALYSVYQTLRDELSTTLKDDTNCPNFLVGSVRPGIVDTPMQEQIRASDDSAFPSKQFFQSMYEERVKSTKKDSDNSEHGVAPPSNALDSSENVGIFCRFLLCETSDKEFSAEEWDIRETTHHSRWLSKA